MNSGTGKSFFLYAALLIGLVAITAVFAADQFEETLVVEHGKAGKALVKFDMASCNLRVTGFAVNLMEGEFVYSKKSMKPKLDYREKGGAGRLIVSQPRTMAPPGKMSNDWYVRLTNDVPLDLEVSSASGESRLNLRGIDLAGLEVEHKNGNAIISTIGEYPGLDHISLKNSSGAVKLTMSGGYPALESIDLVVNSGFAGLALAGKYGSPLDVKTRINIGHVEMAMAGVYAAPSKLSVEITSGDATVNLAGDWKADLEARIETASGDIAVKLPKKAGVIVETAAATVSAPGFKARHNAFTNDIYKNDAYGKSPVTLSIKVKTTGGSVKLELAED
jgi:hypothetical protein